MRDGRQVRDGADAEAYLAELVPNVDPPPLLAAGWAELFAREGVATHPSDWSDLELGVIGRSVFAVGYDAEDAIPELRALATKREAFVVLGGVHVHEPMVMLAAIRTPDELSAPDDLTLLQHGDIVLAHLPMKELTLARGHWPPSCSTTRSRRRPCCR